MYRLEFAGHMCTMISDRQNAFYEVLVESNNQYAELVLAQFQQGTLLIRHRTLLFYF